MTVWEALSTYGLPILAGIASAGVCSVGFSLGLWRTCRSLRLRLTDLEEAHLKARNRSYALKRWGTQEQLEQELKELETTPTAKRGVKRYDNDPLEY